MWTWDLPSLPKLENVVSLQISQRYDLHDLETDRLVTEINKIREIYQNENLNTEKYECNEAN